MPGNLPFVMSGVGNTGVVGNIGNNNIRKFNQNSITIDIFGNCFYRGYDFAASDDVGVLWNSNFPFSRNTLLFICSVINTRLKGFYSYGHKLRASQAHDIEITLPSKNDKPDFEFMETFISAIQKLTIANVEKWLNLRIATTKAIVAKN